MAYDKANEYTSQPWLFHALEYLKEATHNIVRKYPLLQDEQTELVPVFWCLSNIDAM